MNKTYGTLLDPTQLKHNTFVVIEETNNCFEIGLVRETELQKDKKELKILILTAGGFSTKTPEIDKIKNPFLPNATQEIEMNTYTLYSVHPMLVIVLLQQQKEYLEIQSEKTSELKAFLEMRQTIINIIHNNHCNY